jgi:ABC-type glycerol-3-phosphate transport system substrate-binding protein
MNRFTIIAATGFLALALTACGEQNNKQPTATTTDSTTTTTTTPPAEPQPQQPAGTPTQPQQ